MATVQRQGGSGQHVQVGRDVSGGSTVQVGNITINIHQSQPQEAKRELPTTVGGLLGLIGDLKPNEHKSFLKFLYSMLGDLPLEKVDAATMRRVNAYVGAIFERRQ